MTLTLLWLILWFLDSGPRVAEWNGWLIGLMICVIVDFLTCRGIVKLWRS